MVAVNNPANSVSVLLGDGSGTFGTRTDYETGAGSSSWRSVTWTGTCTPTSRRPTASAAVRCCSVTETGRSGEDGLRGGERLRYSVAIGDLNGALNPDVAVANYSSSTVHVLLGNGDGTFVAGGDFSTGSNPRSVAIGDLDGNGRPDLATANEGAGTVSVIARQR